MNAKKKIRLSIIIACFNDGQFIKDSISSAECGLDPIYEVIIINDGSTDLLTCKVLEELDQSGYKVIHQSNQGVAAARNAGIKLAQGEYILPLDPDNYIRSDYIRKGVNILDKFPDVAVVYCDVERFAEGVYDLDKIPSYNLDYENISLDNGFKAIQKVPDFNLSLLVNHNYIDACAVFRKSAGEKCGFYDTNTPFGCYSDWDLWLSIAKRGHRFYHIPEVFLIYRIRSNSLSISARSETRAKAVYKYFAKKHFALFPKEYRYFFRPYRRIIKFWDMVKSYFRLSPNK